MSGKMLICEDLKTIYGSRNADQGVAKLLIGIDGATSRLNKALRTGKLRPEDARREVARIAARVIGIAILVEVDLFETVWSKYHYLCPYCTRCPCACGEEACKPRAVHGSWERMSGLDYTKMDTYQGILDEIFGHANRCAGLPSLVSHLFEEIAEVRRAFDRGKDSEVAEELADVMAFVFAVGNYFGFSVNSALVDRYGAGCPVCHAALCACPKD